LSVFHASIDPNAVIGDRLGSSGAGTREEVVRAEGPVSNSAALSAFHVSIDPNAVIGDRLGSSGAGTREEVVPLA
jgi:hypothetical protein